VHYYAHETAVIDKGAEIGKGCRIWHFTHVCSNVIIGGNVSLGQNVFVGNDVKIGNNCKIQNNVSIYEGVNLAEDVFCGPSMVFTNVYNPRASIKRQDQFKKTVVEKGVSFGANCTIVCGKTIGTYAFIGAGAVVTSDVLPFALFVGVPARQIGWMSQYGEQIDLPIRGDGEAFCKYTGAKYQLKGSTLTCESI
jgi:UDP-2-acetamido-3-amino-2,3-dideoxy-glucuronate N-acetyltransferase